MLLFLIVLLLIGKSKYSQEICLAFFSNPPFYAIVILGCMSIALGSSNQYLAYDLKFWLLGLLVLVGIVVLDGNISHSYDIE